MPQFIHPLHDHVLTRGFAYLSSLYVGGQHAAADYIRRTGPTRAAPIRAVADGTVAGVGWDFYSGFFVAVDHAGGWRSFYRHLYGQTPVVVGQHVTQGQTIGNVGNTGASLGDHLHFDLWCREKRDPTAFWKNGWWAHDPELYLGAETEEEDEMTDEQMETLSSYHERTLRALQAIINHQKASDPARDSHTTIEANRVIRAIPAAGGAPTAAQLKQAMLDAARELAR